jgi:hypothetical protein
LIEKMLELEKANLKEFGWSPKEWTLNGGNH